MTEIPEKTVREKIHESATAVVEAAQDVFVADSFTIDSTARRLLEIAALPSMKTILGEKPDVGPPDAWSCEGQTNWYLVMGVINFHFFYPDGQQYEVQVAADGKVHSGSMAGAAVLTAWAAEAEAEWTPDFLATVEFEDFKQRFVSLQGQDIPLVEVRYKNVVETFRKIQKTGKKLTELLDRHKGDVSELLAFLVDFFPAFDDSATYLPAKGAAFEVFFYKRAQLFVADLVRRCPAPGVAYSLEQLTAFADYRVPQMLLYYRVIRYSEKLSRAVKNDFLQAGSREEIEIRAASIVACRLLAAAAGLAEADIDHILWFERRNLASQEIPLETEYPFHRVVTSAY